LFVKRVLPEIVIAPVGGGGLLSGTSACVKGINKAIQVIGAEPLNANDAFLSFTTRKLTPSVNTVTYADGLLTSLSELTFTVIKSNVDKIITVTEDSIIGCMILVWERMKILIETSSAVPVAAILEGEINLKEKRVGIILSGGNVDLDHLPWIA